MIKVHTIQFDATTLKRNNGVRTHSIEVAGNAPLLEFENAYRADDDTNTYTARLKCRTDGGGLIDFDLGPDDTAEWNLIVILCGIVDIPTTERGTWQYTYTHGLPRVDPFCTLLQEDPFLLRFDVTVRFSAPAARVCEYVFLQQTARSRQNSGGPAIVDWDLVKCTPTG